VLVEERATERPSDDGAINTPVHRPSGLRLWAAAIASQREGTWDLSSGLLRSVDLFIFQR
jgi:hypothetical protein